MPTSVGTIEGKPGRSLYTHQQSDELTLAAEKSEALVITKRRVHNKLEVNYAGHIIALKRLWYLRVQIDMKLGFIEHA